MRSVAEHDQRLGDGRGQRRQPIAERGRLAVRPARADHDLGSMYVDGARDRFGTGAQHHAPGGDAGRRHGG